MTIHLTGKNALIIVQVLCMIALAIIPLVADPAHLGWPRWIIPMWTIVGVGVLSVFVQAHLQSKEDHQRETKEQKRDAVQEGILAHVEQLATKPETSLAETKMEALEHPINFDAIKQFKTAYQSASTLDVEKRIRVAASQNKSAMSLEDFYVKFIGIGTVSYLHDITWAYIFKSQILMLLELNRRGGAMSTADAKVFYDEAAAKFPQVYSKYAFEQWIDFMKTQQLIIPHENGVIEITIRGRDFIAYSAHTSHTADQRRY